MILFDVEDRKKKIEEIERLMSRSEFWENPEEGRHRTKELARLKEPIEEYEDLARRAADVLELVEIADIEGEHSVLGEVSQEVLSIRRQARKLELMVLLNGPYDRNNAILSLHPGAGGTESQDWAQMLLRMYVRWAERNGFQTEVLDFLEGEEAGIKSATLLVSGEYAYGFLRPEKGVHRLVRISPFDASGRRHTSFASVDVLPELEDDDEIEIDPEDLRIDTFRSSGAGGQHVNKTDSAVRITHLPTGIVVTCQKERSQHSNRITAMRILKAKLLELKEEERRKEIASLRGEKTEIGWGNQIRSYVFQPYSLVKDHRTGTEVGNVQGVMDGDIDEFIYAYLKRNARGQFVESSRNFKGIRRNEEKQQ